MDNSSLYKTVAGEQVVMAIYDHALRALTMPVLLLGGTKDIMRDMNKIEVRLREFVPHLDAQMIEGGGHALLNTGEYVMNFLGQASVENPSQAALIYG